MQNSTFSLSSILCVTLGHQYNITNKITNHINEYKCNHCGKEVTEDILENIEELTSSQRKINESVALFFQKKNAKNIYQQL